MAFPRYNIQPGYVYSGGMMPAPLPPHGPYAAPAYYYPYPVVGYPPQVQQQASPRVQRRKFATTPTEAFLSLSWLGPISPNPEIELHPVLSSSRSRMLHWLVTEEPTLAMNNPALNNMGPLPPNILNQAATSPGCDNMVLVSDDFPWTITLQVPSDEFITVRQILGAIFGSLQQTLQHDEWDELSRNSKTNAHRSRCVRLARLPPRFNVPTDIVAIRRVDTLAEKIAFMGIKRVGDPSNPSAWNVRLGYASDRDQVRRR
ncbi:hypothetical protein Clacol_009436 [Clathrus columnatus]|uniref:DUF6699 domain-containing protein n=1 Tax=Clathrus columnatus TaxID=1419009 RepID=A0AAV5AQJ3_9AGAM|nr:hypothetical protein Clacol_009436 [Clathrus columnatus]